MILGLRTSQGFVIEGGRMLILQMSPREIQHILGNMQKEEVMYGVRSGWHNTCQKSLSILVHQEIEWLEDLDDCDVYQYFCWMWYLRGIKFSHLYKRTR